MGRIQQTIEVTRKYKQWFIGSCDRQLTIKESVIKSKFNILILTKVIKTKKKKNYY